MIGNSKSRIFTEVARQPWGIFGLQKAEDTVFPSGSAAELLISFNGFTAL